MSDTDQSQEDDVLRRMLNTAPKPHKESKKERKPRDKKDRKPA
jgi:hypothetical protein